MIIEVPSHGDFSDTALSHLHMAWDIGTRLVGELDEAQLDDAELSEEYWRLSQPSLANAYSLIQQAQEFQLKALIAATSPYLLLSRDPRDWPRGCEKQDVPFSAFRMADAADLIRIHDTTSATRLPRDFAAFYEQVRRQRNVIMHFGHRGQRIDVARVLTDALRTHSYLFGPPSWPLKRHAYLNSDRIAAIYSNDHAGDALLVEFDRVVEMLKPADLRAFFGFDKRARRYICANCMGEAENEIIRLAQLRPNAPDAAELFCFVCEQASPVLRERCKQKDCRSNVLSAYADYEGMCLVCWQ